MLGLFFDITGYGHVVLNICRFFNVVGLLMATAACALIVARTGERNVSWWFFDDVSYIFSGLSALFLLLSELPIIGFVRRYFEMHWPVLSPAHGFSWLATFMAIIGFHILGAPYNPRRNLSGAFGSTVLAGGFLCFVAAALTFVASCLFRDPKAGLNARVIRSDGKLASPKPSHADTYSSRSDSLRARTSPAITATKKRSVVARLLSAAIPALVCRNDDNDDNIGYSYNTDAAERSRRHRAALRYNISAPLRPADLETGPEPCERASPIVPGLKRPDTALHPIHLGRSPSSRYSEASYMNRF